MSQLQGESDGLVITAKAEVVGGTNDLTGYPYLTYAPFQWGEGIRTANNGTSVDDIARDATAPCVLINCIVEFPSLVQDLDRLAQSHGITWPELFDALRYGRDKGLV